MSFTPSVKILYIRKTVMYFFYDKARKKSLEKVEKYALLYPKARHVHKVGALVALREEILVVFGGDGTFHRVVNTIDFSNYMVLVPCGSGNDFVRNFEPVAASEILKYPKNQTFKRVGLLKINEVYGLNAAGFFYDAKVAETANGITKKWGSLSYTMAALKYIFTYKPQRVLVNDVPQSLLMLSFGNGAYAGGGFKLFPKTHPAQFSMMRLQLGSLNIVKRLLYLVLIKFGWHGKIRNIDLCECTYTSLKSMQNLHGEVDGELYDFGNHVNVGYVANALWVLVAD